MNQVFTVGTQFSNYFKATETCIKLIKGTQSIIKYFTSQINHFENIDIYFDFSSRLKRLHLIIGKPQSDQRRSFNNRMKSEKSKTTKNTTNFSKLSK